MGDGDQAAGAQQLTERLKARVGLFQNSSALTARILSNGASKAGTSRAREWIIEVEPHFKSRGSFMPQDGLVPIGLASRRLSPSDL